MARDTLEDIILELRDFHLWKAVRTEYLGTALVVLLGCGSTLDWATAATPATTTPTSTTSVANGARAGSGVGCPAAQTGLRGLTAGLGFGLAVASLVQATGHVSGGHLSPAVTAAWLVARKLTVVRALLYCAAQCAGAVSGAAMLYGLVPPSLRKETGLGVTRLHEEVRQVQGFGVEFLATFAVVLVQLATVDGKRHDLGSRPLAVGLVVTAAHLFAYNFTGASLNPARSLGPALVLRSWENHWLYWVGPVLGGVLAGFTYQYTEQSGTSFDSIRPTFKEKTQYLFSTRAAAWPAVGGGGLLSGGGAVGGDAADLLNSGGQRRGGCADTPPEPPLTGAHTELTAVGCDYSRHSAAVHGAGTVAEGQDGGRPAAAPVSTYPAPPLADGWRSHIDEGDKERELSPSRTGGGGGGGVCGCDSRCDGRSGDDAPYGDHLCFNGDAFRHDSSKV